MEFNRDKKNFGRKSSDGFGSRRRSGERKGMSDRRSSGWKRSGGRDAGDRFSGNGSEAAGDQERPERERQAARYNIVVKDNTTLTMAQEMGIGEELDMLFGIHPVIEAINAGKAIEKLYFRRGLEGEGFRKLMDLAQEKEIPFQFVPLERLNRLTQSNHQGVVAAIPKVKYVSMESVIDDYPAEENPIVVLLDGVTDVRNFGAIVRTAECAGAVAVVVPAKGGASINADAIKASAGALLRMDTVKVPNLRSAIYLLKESGFRIVAATEKSETEMYSCDLKGPVAIVMGSEGKGVSSSVLDECDEKVCIPMEGGVGSLNVSVATAVVLYEAVRQRREAAAEVSSAD